MLTFADCDLSQFLFAESYRLHRRGFWADVRALLGCGLHRLLDCQATSQSADATRRARKRLASRHLTGAVITDSLVPGFERRIADA
jgi:hypothetical protein